MSITDPQAILACNEGLRPLCERIRSLHADINAFRAKYDGQFGALFYGHNAEPIEDGREAEGASRLIGNDMLAFVQLILYDLKATLDNPGNAATIAKPCRPILL